MLHKWSLWGDAWQLSAFRVKVSCLGVSARGEAQSSTGVSVSHGSRVVKGNLGGGISGGAGLRDLRVLMQPGNDAEHALKGRRYNPDRAVKALIFGMVRGVYLC